MGLYNLISCAGFSDKASGYVASSGCFQGRMGFVLLFFIVAILRKWGGEEVGLEYNFLLGLVFSLVPYCLVVTFTGSTKIAIVVGLIGAAAGGYFGGLLFGGSEEF